MRQKSVNFFLAPIFLDARINLDTEPTTPYIDFNVGFLKDLNGTSKGGIIFAITPGYSLQASKNSSILLGLGFAVNKIRIDLPPNNRYSREYTLNLNAITFNLGLTF